MMDVSPAGEGKLPPEQLLLLWVKHQQEREAVKVKLLLITVTPLAKYFRLLSNIIIVYILNLSTYLYIYLGS
jgi:hypothetical protein